MQYMYSGMPEKEQNNKSACIQGENRTWSLCKMLPVNDKSPSNNIAEPNNI